MAQSFPFYNISSFNSTLNEQEIKSFKTSFPNLNGNNIRKLGPATHDLRILADKDGKTVFPENPNNIAYVRDLCHLHGCDIQEEYYLKSADGAILNKVDAKTCSIIESYHYADLKCITLTSTSLEYNCIGWSLGIRGWINPIEGEIDKPEIATTLNRFLKSQQIQFPKNHEKNVLNILDKINVEKSCIADAKTDIAFFFTQAKQDANKLEMTHGARYIDVLNEVNNAQVASWTSKLGHELLISHELSDLSDSSSKASYGLPLCYGYYETENILIPNDEMARLDQHDEL